MTRGSIKVKVSKIGFLDLQLLHFTVIAVGHTEEQKNSDSVLGKPISGKIGQKASLLAHDETARITDSCIRRHLWDLVKIRKTTNKTII